MNAASKLMVVHDTKNIKRLKSDRVLTAPCGSEAFGKLGARRALPRMRQTDSTRVLARSYEDLIVSA